MCKYFALTFIFYLLVFAKSADISNSAIKFTSEINYDNVNNDNKVANKNILSYFDQTIFKNECIHTPTTPLLTKKNDLLNENEVQKEKIKEQIFESKIANIQQTNNTNKYRSQHPKASSVFFEIFFINFKTVNPNASFHVDTAVKSNTSPYSIRDYEEDYKTKRNFNYVNDTQCKIQNEKRNEFQTDLSKIKPSEMIVKQVPLTLNEESKKIQFSTPSDTIFTNNALQEYFLKKRGTLSYQEADRRNLNNDILKQNELNFLTDIKPDQKRQHVYKSVKKDLSRLFLHKNNDYLATDFFFPKLPMSSFLLPTFKPKDLASIKKKTKRSDMHKKDDPISIMTFQSNLMDYFLNSILLGHLVPKTEKYVDSDARLMVDTIISDGKGFFLNREVFKEPKHHHYHNKHKRRNFSKQISTTAATSTDKGFVELLFKNDDEDEVIKAIIDVFNDDKKREALRKKREFTFENIPTLGDNPVEEILTEKSSETYQQHQQCQVCRIKRNGLLSSTIPSVACLMLSLGFLCYFMHKRKWFHKARECNWFAVPDGTEIRETLFEINTKNENQK